MAREPLVGIGCINFNIRRYGNSNSLLLVDVAIDGAIGMRIEIFWCVSVIRKTVAVSMCCILLFLPPNIAKQTVSV